MHDRAPAGALGERPEQHKAGGEPERPTRDRDRHRGDDLAADEPVGDHLGAENVDEYGTGAGDEPSRCHEGERGRKAHQRAARSHQGEPDHHDLLGTEALAEHAARQRDRDAGQQIEPDQQAERREIDRERVHQERPYRGDGLELKGHRGPRQEQHGQHEPAIVDSRHGAPRRAGHGNARCQFNRAKITPGLSPHFPESLDGNFRLGTLRRGQLGFWLRGARVSNVSATSLTRPSD